MDILALELSVRSRDGCDHRPVARERRRAETAAFYQQNADDYAASTLGLNVGQSIDRFVGLLPVGARVLDVGCGAGRDLLALKRAGLKPAGLELSKELATIARRVSGVPVTVGDLRQPPVELQELDGIWAMASLLHLDRGEVTEALARLRELLVPGGVFFASVKRGSGIVQDQDGRWFTLHDEDGWAKNLAAAGFDLLEIIGEPPASASATSSVAPGWVSSIARRPC